MTELTQVNAHAQLRPRGCLLHEACERSEVERSTIVAEEMQGKRDLFSSLLLTHRSIESVMLNY